MLIHPITILIKRLLLHLYPFGGLTIYLVGDIAPAGLLFQVEDADKNFISITKGELAQLGFVVVRLNSRMARVVFGSDSFYALPKPVPLYIAENNNGAAAVIDVNPIN